MCDQNMLISTKNILKFLINSKPGFQTVHSLNVDFYNYTGRFVPFYELGYCYLVTFLQSIPDILKVNFYTQEVQPLNKKCDGHTADSLLSYNPNENSVPCPMICCSIQPPPTINYVSRYQPRELPWVRSSRNETELKKRTFRPVPIKSPVSDKTTTSSPPLGPRSYGDGKCSTPDSIKNLQDLEFIVPTDKALLSALEVAFTNNQGQILNPSNCSYQENVSDQETISNFEKNHYRDIGQEPYNYFELYEGEELKFQKHFENNNESEATIPVTAIKESSSSLSSTEFEINMTPPPAYSEKDVIPNDELTINYDLDYYSSSSEEEEKVLATTDNVAIPFMFQEDDDPINMLDSGFGDKYGAKYETKTIDSIMKVGSFYELYISEVHNPYKFWFQLADENPNTVDELQEQLNMYYGTTTSYDSPDMIKKVHIAKGYACAAKYGQIWHRAEILEQPKGETVKVFFVDYGTIDQVSVNDVRYLIDSFAAIPKLCLRGTLDFIKPRNSRWVAEDTNFFKSLIEDAKLVTGVSEVDCKTNSVRLYIMDRERNININHKMVYDGYAFPDDPRTRYQRHIAEVVPTFDNLENGIHPSLDEIFRLLTEGYDVEKQVEAKVIGDVDCYIPQHISGEETLRRIENFKREREKAKHLAKQKDASIFLQFFGALLQNPFLNGMMTDAISEE